MSFHCLLPRFLALLIERLATTPDVNDQHFNVTAALSVRAVVAVVAVDVLTGCATVCVHGSVRIRQSYVFVTLVSACPLGVHWFPSSADSPSRPSISWRQ